MVLIIKFGYITARDQSMVESGVTEGGKNTASFLFRQWTQQHSQPNTNMKPHAKSNDFQSYPRREAAASGEKDGDNIRKVLWKSFIQCFWELNLCSYKYRVDCFDALRLSIFFCCYWSTLKWKSRNITKHLMSGPSETS